MHPLKPIALLALLTLLTACTFGGVTSTPIPTRPPTNTPQESFIRTPGPLSTGDMNAFVPMEDGSAEITVTGDLVSAGTTRGVIFRQERPVNPVRGERFEFIAEIVVETSDLLNSNSLRLRISYPADLPPGTYTLTDGTPFDVRITDNITQPDAVYDNDVRGTIALYQSGTTLQALFEFDISGRWQDIVPLEDGRVSNALIQSQITVSGVVNGLPITPP